MKRTILDSLNSIPYFTIAGVKQLWGGSSAEDGTLRTALYRWMKSGQVFQLKKGIYMTRRFYELHRGDADFSPAISAILLQHSYVSLEFILQRHGVLTEVTYPVTAVTTRNTRVIENDLGLYSYRHMKDSLYCGFTIAEYHGIPFARASAAKALFDYLYLRPGTNKVLRNQEPHSASYNLAEDLRLNLAEFAPADREEFAEYIRQAQVVKMSQILSNIRKTAWRH